MCSGTRAQPAHVRSATHVCAQRHARPGPQLCSLAPSPSLPPSPATHSTHHRLPSVASTLVRAQDVAGDWQGVHHLRRVNGVRRGAAVPRCHRDDDPRAQCRGSRRVPAIGRASAFQRVARRAREPDAPQPRRRARERADGGGKSDGGGAEDLRHASRCMLSIEPLPVRDARWRERRFLRPQHHQAARRGAEGACKRRERGRACCQEGDG